MYYIKSLFITTLKTPLDKLLRDNSRK